MSEEKKSFLRSMASWNSDRVVSFCAIFISLMSLVTFVYQTNLMDKQSRLSVYPYLAVTTNFNPNLPEFSILLENLGVGPAVIENRIIILNGKRYNKNLHEILYEIDSSLIDYSAISYASIGKGDVIPIGSERQVLGIAGDSTQVFDFVNRFSKLSDTQLDFEITYKSIYGDRWLLTSASNDPIKL